MNLLPLACAALFTALGTVMHAFCSLTSGLGMDAGQSLAAGQTGISIIAGLIACFLAACMYRGAPAPRPGMPQRRQCHDGFTLIELLVVVMIIVCLVPIFIGVVSSPDSFVYKFTVGTVLPLTGFSSASAGWLSVMVAVVSIGFILMSGRALITCYDAWRNPRGQ